MKRLLALVSAFALFCTPVMAAVPQPNWVAGVYTIAPGPDQLPPAAQNAFYIAWAVDRPGSAGFMVSDGTQWLSDIGPAGATGAQGPAGTNGNTILSGTGAPSSQGVNGDFYVDVAVMRMYGPKTSGIWGSGVSLVGSPGTNGTTGPQGPAGPAGPTGPAGPASVGSPASRTLSLATAYQATDTSKAAFITVNLNSTANLSLTGGTTNTATIVIGSTNAVAGGTGTTVGTYTNSSTGTLTIGLNTNTQSGVSYSFILPAGWYFSIRAGSGTVTIVSAFDQSIG